MSRFKIEITKEVGSREMYDNLRFYRPVGSQLLATEYSDEFFRIDPNEYEAPLGEYGTPSPHHWLVSKKFAVQI
jgi:hypothetical protein